MVTTELAEAVLERAGREISSEETDVWSSSPFVCIATAARYLRGYHSVHKAAKNMVATFRYRCAVHADDLGTSQETFKTVYSELRKRSMFIAALSDGNDPSSPVLILRKRGEAFDREDFEEYRRSFFFTLDCTAKLADRQLSENDAINEQTGQWVIVMDMDGYTRKNSPPIGVSLETLGIFQNHFPERAKKIVVLDAPPAFNLLWKVIRPFIDPVTRAKFIFTSRSVGENQLREEVGGDIVFNCINADLDDGKRQSAKFMVEAGFLREEDAETTSVAAVS